MNDDESDVDWAPMAKALKNLPREAVLPPGTLAAVRHWNRGGAPAFTRKLGIVAALAASLVVGFLAGNWRRVPDQSEVEFTSAVAMAMEIQRTGTEYAWAVTRLADAAATASDAGARAQGAEAALATLHASALALRSLWPDDATSEEIVASIRRAREHVRPAPPPLSGGS